MAAPVSLRVALTAEQADRSYDILIGPDLLTQAGALIAERLGKRRCMIVTDTHVAPHYAAKLLGALQSSGHTTLPAVTVPAGETHKNFTTLQNILEQMLNEGIDRKTLVIALGGGVVGDMAGFAAATALRGLDYVQIPTTLLAQVDSAVGGKTAIDMPQGKNLVGAFHQPRLVLTDTATLATLPSREMRAGYAEIVKYGLICDAAFYDWCEQNGAKILQGDAAALAHAIHTSCATKARIVAADERETGRRALLNLGHTFGHALETAEGYSGTLLHGEAVAIGMLLALRLSVELGFCPAGDLQRVEKHLAALQMPLKPPRAHHVDQLMKLMEQDKKAEAGKLVLVLARGIGKAFVARDVAPDKVRKIWQSV